MLDYDFTYSKLPDMALLFGENAHWFLKRKVQVGLQNKLFNTLVVLCINLQE